MGVWACVSECVLAPHLNFGLRWLCSCQPVLSACSVTYWLIVPEPVESWPLYFDYGTAPDQKPMTHVRSHRIHGLAF